ncbi:hypothetical protein SDC9_121010 [bioreactor metagenome]|uniref:Uncharacterized protein n=1 Tax=bioreactor metagenome TaxID=1076179 RepID=A0A645CAS2_9ZZZZ
MAPRYRQRYVGQLFAAVPDLVPVKGGAQHAHIGGAPVAVCPLAKGHYLTVKATQGLYRVFVIAVCNHPAVGQPRKFAKAGF